MIEWNISLVLFTLMRRAIGYSQSKSRWKKSSDVATYTANEIYISSLSSTLRWTTDLSVVLPCTSHLPRLLTQVIFNYCALILSSSSSHIHEVTEVTTLGYVVSCFDVFEYI